jgi:glutamyl-tRNA synthetase
MPLFFEYIFLGCYNSIIMKIRTRFAPSPTGSPESVHLGFVIRALWAYAYAKKNKGEFVLRIEDTDQKRSRKDTEEEIYKVLKKFGINWDEGPDVGGPYAPYRQSERLKKYREAAKLLVEKGYAYYDFDAVKREKEEIKEAYESKEELSKLKIRPEARSGKLEDSLKRIEKGEPYVVRVKIPEDKKFEYNDWILKKKIKFFGKEVPDMILLKSDGFPTYHLAVVVDDIDMKISHVFRGQEWISSTPIHLFLYEAFGVKPPEFGHFTVILDPKTKKKFSKRDMTAMFGVNTWLNEGYLPDAVLNYLMLLGWAPKDNREFFTLGEFVEAFDQDGLQKANPIFDATKLEWMNGEYIRKLSDETLTNIIHKFYEGKYDIESLKKVVPLIKTRIKKLSDVEPLAGFLLHPNQMPVPLINLTPNYESHVSNATISRLDNISEAEWNLNNINEAFGAVIQETNSKVGEFYMDIRGTVAGSSSTPPINDAIVILGKDKTIERLKEGLDMHLKKKD